MIVCAAIKIHVYGSGVDTVICGHRHGDCFSILHDVGLKPGTGYKELAQGFITHENKFLDRFEAYKHALDCGQLSANNRWYKQDHGEVELYSEDLY